MSSRATPVVDADRPPALPSASWPPSSRLAAYAVCFDAGDVLLVQHSSGTWTLPGGTVVHAEDPCDTVVREVRESTGCETVVDRLLGIDSRVVPAAERRPDLHVGHLVGVHYLVRIVGVHLCSRPNAEMASTVWASPAEVRTLRRSPSVDVGLAMAHTLPATGRVAPVRGGGLLQH